MSIPEEHVLVIPRRLFDELGSFQGLCTDTHRYVAALRDATQRMVFARQLFNDAVGSYNAAARQFPTRLLSALFGFGAAGML